MEKATDQGWEPLAGRQEDGQPTIWEIVRVSGAAGALLAFTAMVAIAVSVWW